MLGPRGFFFQRETPGVGRRTQHEDPTRVVFALQWNIGLKPCTHVASHLFAIHLRLDVRIACNGLQQKFQHAEYFTWHPLIS